MKSDQVEAITEAAITLLRQLDDCHDHDAREAIGQRVHANITEAFPAHFRELYGLPKPVDKEDGFQWLRVFVYAVTQEAGTGVPSKG